VLNGYVVAAAVPPAEWALLLVVSLLVTADWYRPARRALGPLLLVACASLLAGIGSLVAMVSA
jgi:hypothetical protein